jgi:hypothetical protein
MNTKLLIENLNKTRHSLTFARNDFRAALHHADAVQSLLILDEIPRIVASLNNVDRLLNALASEE